MRPSPFVSSELKPPPARVGEVLGEVDGEFPPGMVEEGGAVLDGTEVLAGGAELLAGGTEFPAGGAELLAGGAEVPAGGAELVAAPPGALPDAGADDGALCASATAAIGNATTSASVGDLRFLLMILSCA